MDARPSAARAGMRALAGLALLAAACADAKPAPRGHAVAIRGFQYVPATLTVAVGDTVVWTNQDVVPHTATAQDRGWDTGSLAAQASGRIVADRAGRQAYLCAFHPGMQAELVVE
jgi:plastocyanin